MLILEKIDFEKVLERFYRDHLLDLEHEENTNQKAEEALVLINSQLGEWHKAWVGRADIKSVILPWHISCGGKTELAPKTGLTVGRAVEKILNMGDAFARENPVCSQKIERMSRLPFTPLFLSTRAIKKDDYWDLTRKEGLIHIDGLHRMISWELHGRLSEQTQIEAYIAGPVYVNRDLKKSEVRSYCKKSRTGGRGQTSLIIDKKRG